MNKWHWYPWWLCIWYSCSVINWFLVAGEFNERFRVTGKYQDKLFWSMIGSLSAGGAGLLGTILDRRYKKLAWRLLTKKEQEQHLMLRKLEGYDINELDYGNYASPKKI